MSLDMAALQQPQSVETLGKVVEIVKALENLVLAGEKIDASNIISPPDRINAALAESANLKAQHGEKLKETKVKLGDSPEAEASDAIVSTEIANLQARIWELEHENSELQNKIPKAATDTDKLSYILDIVCGAFPEEAAAYFESDKVKLGTVLEDSKRVEVMVDRIEYQKLNFENPEKATKELCQLVFGLDILATHTLTGKPCNASPKPPLDGQKVKLIIDHVMKKFKRGNQQGKMFDHKLNQYRELMVSDLEEAIQRKCSYAATVWQKNNMPQED